MTDFELKLKQAAENAVLRFITEGQWLAGDYGSRIKVGPELWQGAWALVDQDAIKRKIAERIEQELADRVVNNIAAELATDIKQLLSNNERREMLRSLARQHLDSFR